MKTLLFTILFFPTLAFAQGGIGVNPRSDLVMLSAMTRDSLSDVVLANIHAIKRMAETGQVDSAASRMAWKDTTGRWTRAVNPGIPTEHQYVAGTLAKIKTLFHTYPDMEPMYYAVFKTKETPSGQKHLYQIKQTNGRRSRMVSWVFYRIGNKLLLASF